MDFVITDGLKPQKLIQVSLDVSSPDTMKRETRALLKAMKEFDLKEGLIITEDYSGEEHNKGRHIKFIPLYERLLLKNRTRALRKPNILQLNIHNSMSSSL